MLFQGLAEEFARIARDLAAQPSPAATLEAIVRYAVQTVDGAEEAAITVRHGSRYQTVVATGELPLRVDEIQYEANEGPCVDSLREHHVFSTDELAEDPRWPVFGPLAAKRTEVRSMMSCRLFLEEDSAALGALNLYSRQPAAFSGYRLEILDALAAHSAIALAKANAQEQNEHLQAALARNRTIGAAMGILMATHKLTDAQSFDLLRLASQHSHRKLYDIARDVVDTGALELEP